MPAWVYLENGGRHAELIWHRRSGKDEICLHRTAVAAFERVATYWHMLPMANQARKAIWEAVNPHTGKRRIDEAFPVDLREVTRENEMMIRFLNGSTWQVVGSDNFNSLVGSPPAGIVYSEWALSNPSARGYLRPILAENGGWQIFITTPRGKNHAYQTFKSAQGEPGAFAQKLTVDDTGIFTPGQLETEQKAYVADFGPDAGQALFEQEYLCSFDAAILGAYYGRELAAMERQGRICEVPWEPALPVFTAWDLGFSDDTTIWFFQVLRGEVRLIDYYFASGQDVPHYADVIKAKPYTYGMNWLPHDARPKTLAANGRSILQQLLSLGLKCQIVPNLSVEDGIQAARHLLNRLWIDAEKCAEGLEALKLYQREWDDDKKMFRDKPRHDWTSHAADAFRYMALVWKNPVAKPEADKPRFLHEATFDEVMWAKTKKVERRI